MFELELSKGLFAGHATVNKFGCAVAGIQTSATDLWDRADATQTQRIWLAPTAPRIHTIASTDAGDDTGGIGANSVTISYLPDWDSKEKTETVTGDLSSGIAMNNAAVMIHRMKVNPQATSTTTNTGIITATAATDSTVTAQINIGWGQTQMAIYGFGSTQTAYLTQWYASIHKASGAAAHVNYQLRFNPNPNVQTVTFLSKETRGLQSTGNSNKGFPHDDLPKKFPGPGILKVQGAASAADIEGAAGFNLVMLDNDLNPKHALTTALYR